MSVIDMTGNMQATKMSKGITCRSFYLLCSISDVNIATLISTQNSKISQHIYSLLKLLILLILYIAFSICILQVHIVTW